MKGKPATLASAGKRLTGPPEGYGRKKELQVKQWLTVAAQQTSDVAPIAGPEIVAEPSVYPNASLDDVYRQLRDSTDNIAEVFNQNAANTSVSTALPDGADPNVQVCLHTAPAELPGLHENQQCKACADVAVAADVPADQAGSKGESQSNACSIESPQQSAVASVSRKQHDPNVAVALSSTNAADNMASTRFTPPSVAGAHESAKAVLSGAPARDNSQQDQQLSSPAAAILHMLSCAEAGEQVDNPEVAQLKLALLKAATEHQEYMQQTRLELAAARAAAETAKSQASEQVQQVKVQLAAVQQQLAAAETQAAAAAAAGIAAQHEAKRQRIEAEDALAEQAEQMQAMQLQLQHATQQMKKLQESHKQALQLLQQQLEESKQEAATSKRQVQLAEGNAALTQSKLNSQLQAAEMQVLQLEQEANEAQEQLRRLREMYAQEQQARQSAEASEAKALQAAAEHAQLFEALLQEAQKGNNASQRKARLLTSAGVALRNSPGAASQNSRKPACTDQQKQASDKALPSAAITALHNQTVRNSSSSAPSTAVAVATDLAQHRVRCHKQLQQGLAAERKALAEVAAVQRRAAAAAELEEGKRVQQLLSAAPEALKVLGLAYRAYAVVLDNAAPCQRSDAAVEPPGSAAQLGLLQQLAKDYAMYIDQSSLQCNGSSGSSEGFLTAVLGLSASLLLVLPSNINMSALLGCLALALKAVRLGRPLVVVGQLTEEQRRSIVHQAADAGWSEQECLVLANCVARSVPFSDNAAASAVTVKQLQQQIGLSDLQVSLLPSTALKKLAAGAAGTLRVPDLCHLSCSSLAHLKLDLSAMQEAVIQQQAHKTPHSSASDGDRQAECAKMATLDQVHSTVLGVVCSVLKHNTTLKVLRLDGVDVNAAEAIAGTICRSLTHFNNSIDGANPCNKVHDNSVGCCLSLLVVNGMSVPIKALLNSFSAAPAAAVTASSHSGSTAALLHELDLISSSGTASKDKNTGCSIVSKAELSLEQQERSGKHLTEEQAAFLAVLLPHCYSLTSLQLPPLIHTACKEVANRLVSAVLALPRLQTFNGVPVHQLSMACRDCSIDTAASISGDNKHSNTGKGSNHKLAEYAKPLVLEWQHVELLDSCSTEAMVGLRPSTSCASIQVLDLNGKVLGAAGAALLGRSLVSANLAVSGLQLRGCHISQYGAGQLAAGLSAVYSAPMPADSHVTGTKLRTQQLVPASSIQQLQVLQLSANQLGPEGLKQLLSGLACDSCLLSQLQVLDLGFNQLGDAGCAVLADYCQHLVSLQLLGLSGNAIGGEGAKVLFSAVCSCHGSSSSSQETTARGMWHTEGQALQDLKVLQLGGNVIGDSGVIALAAAIPCMRQLRQLELQDNYSIGCEGVRALAGVLANASSLVELNLAKNNIGPQGAKLLAAGLQANAAAAAATTAAAQEVSKSDSNGGSSSSFAGLQYLELEWCKLKVEGVVNLAAALVVQQPSTVDGNTGSDSTMQRGTKGVHDVVRGSHCCLRRLGLARNGAGDKGVKAVAEALMFNTSLQYLDLRSNAIGLTGCRMLSTLLQDHNSNIRQLLLSGNMEATDSVEAPVLQALEELASADRSGLMPARKVVAGG